jgi:8-amino-7-oxononanoate synthase
VEAPEAQRVAQALAEWIGCRRGVLATSTLHLFWDLFGDLAQQPVALLWDAGLYPVARWGIERAAARGVPARSFEHHDADDLRRQLRRNEHAGRKPVVVADGYCPGCGAPAPLDAYLQCARERGGLLVLDDTQALGLFGEPRAEAPYGSGGGGSLRRLGLSGGDIVVGGSLAKALGVPVAVAAGARATIARFEEQSETRVHCSPPTMGVIAAAARALEVNQDQGDALRARLAQRVGHFRARLRELGLASAGGQFPVQRLLPVPGLSAATLHERLERGGVRTVLQRPRCGGDSSVSFILTASHTADEIDQAVDALARAVGEQRTAVKERAR